MFVNICGTIPVAAAERGRRLEPRAPQKWSAPHHWLFNTDPVPGSVLGSIWIQIYSNAEPDLYYLTWMRERILYKNLKNYKSAQNYYISVEFLLYPIAEPNFFMFIFGFLDPNPCRSGPLPLSTVQYTHYTLYMYCTPGINKLSCWTGELIIAGISTRQTTSHYNHNSREYIN